MLVLLRTSPAAADPFLMLLAGFTKMSFSASCMERETQLDMPVNGSHSEPLRGV